MNRGRPIAKLSVLLAGAALAGMWAAAGASAHVTVTAPGVTVGSTDAAITFRVPDESATASTVGLKLQLPLGTPLAGVLVAPTPGWTAVITQTKLSTPIHTDDGDISQVVSEIDWTAQTGAGIKPGYFGQFTIIAGKLPAATTTLTFKAIQHYSDGKNVNWVQLAAPGSKVTPDFPAPALTLAPASTPATTPAAATGATTTAKTTNAASKSAATTGIVLGAVGVLLGAAALAITVLRTRRGTTTPSGSGH